VCDFGRLSDTEISQLFSRIAVGEVWGVGRRHAEHLQKLGITTIEDLRTSDPEYIRQQFSIVLERTVKELNGISCIELEDAGVPRQQIMVSRSFGMKVSSLSELSESVSYYATAAAEKLRHDGSVATSVCVFVLTDRFKLTDPQYEKSIVVALHQPSDNTTQIVSAALASLKQIYRAGFSYKKAGVLLMGLHPKSSVQRTLFDDPNVQAKSDKIMNVMDAINLKMGKGSLTTAASGARQRWAMRRESKSPNYTTDWNELPVAQ